MFDLKLVKENFSAAAAEYEKNAQLQKLVRNHCIAIANSLWQRNDTVLDIGSGSTPATGNWNAISLDISLSMCNVARLKNAAVINADAAYLPLADASVDGIFSSLMLQWANKPEEVFLEINRVLKPGSHAVIATLAEGTLFELSESFSKLDESRHVSEFLPPHAILQHAENSGMELASARQMQLVEHYPDTISLMRALQNIGASNKHVLRKRGMSTPRQFAKLDAVYEKFRNSEGLPVTWQVLFLVLRK